MRLPAPVPAVKYERMQETSGGQHRDLSGKLIAAERSQLSFPVKGRVSAVLVEQGGRVVKDQPLARLDPRDFELTLRAEQARLSAARGRVHETREELRRKQILFDKDLVARAALDKAAAASEAALGEAGVAESRLARAGRDLEHTILRAPFAGQIALREIDPFVEVKSGQAVFTLETSAALDVRILVPETLISRIEYGQPVIVAFPGLLRSTLPGVVEKIDAQARIGNAFEVTVRLKGEHPDLRPGMTASVGFDFVRQRDPAQDARKVFLIPLPALSLRTALSAPMNPGGKNSAPAPVYVYDRACACARRRLVKIGGIRGNRIEVFAGLENGDMLITAGVPLLQDGMKVRLWSPIPRF